MELSPVFRPQTSRVTPFTVMEEFDSRPSNCIGGGGAEAGGKREEYSHRDLDHIEGKIKLLRMGNKTIQASALLLLIVILLVQGYQCVLKYIGKPTFISTKIVDQTEAQFPAVTICPYRISYKEKVLQAHGIPSIARYNYKNNLIWFSNNSEVSPKQLFDLATFKVDELVKSIYVRTFQSLNDKSGFYLKVNNSNPPFREQRHRSFGKCYSVMAEEHIRKLGIYYMKIRVHIPAKIYFHRDGQFLDLNGRMGYTIKLRESVQSQISYQKINMLPQEGSDGSLSCTTCRYDDCMYSAVTRHMLEAAGCTVPWVHQNDNICTDQADVNVTFYIAWNRITNQKRDCSSPCQVLVGTVSAKNHEFLPESKPYGEVLYYFPPRIMISEERYFYTFLSLMAEIGGYVGLLLGVSLFHFADWLSDLVELQIEKYEKKAKERQEEEEEGGGRRGTENGNKGNNDGEY